MVRTTIYLSLICFMLAGISAYAQSSNDASKNEKGSTATKTPNVLVYYFHGERRCPTCMAIEKNAKEYVQKKYGEDKSVAFKSVNIEEDKNKTLAEKYKAAGSMLLVVCGDTVEDITTQAFKYARKSPEKFTSILQKKITAVQK